MSVRCSVCVSVCPSVGLFVGRSLDRFLQAMATAKDSASQHRKTSDEMPLETIQTRLGSRESIYQVFKISSVPRAFSDNDLKRSTRRFNRKFNSLLLKLSALRSFSKDGVESGSDKSWSSGMNSNREGSCRAPHGKIILILGKSFRPPPGEQLSSSSNLDPSSRQGRHKNYASALHYGTVPASQ